MQCPVCHGSGVSPGSWRIGFVECGACMGSGHLPDERPRPPRAAPDALERRPAATPVTPPAAALPTDGAALMRMLYGQLKGQYEQEKQSGVVDETAAHGLDRVFQSLDPLVEAAGRDRSLQTMQRERDRLNRLLEEMGDRSRRPSFGTPGPTSGSRAARVLARLHEVKAALGADATRMRRAQGEHEMICDLIYRFARLTAAIHAAADDAAKLRRLEMDDARGLMNEARWYDRRHHPTLARPIWSRATVGRDPNLVFFGGSDAVRRRLAPLAERLGLRLSQASYPGADVGAARWRELRAASLAVFDLSAREPQDYYDLGLALALGTELLLLAEAGTRIEFDVAQEVETYADLSELDRLLPEALDDALYGRGAIRTAGSSLATSVTEVERLAAAQAGNGLLRVALRQLRAAAEDPVALRAAMGECLGFLGADAPVLLYPRWPGVYPAASDRRCFIVMPFRQHLEPTWRAIETGCRQAGRTPVRGDEAEGQEIIASIWEEIGRASHLVVDLTDLNLNVCLELGIADALGRPTLLVGRDGTDKRRLASIAKRRFHGYAAGDEAARLVPLVREFLGGGRPGAPWLDPRWPFSSSAGQLPPFPFGALNSGLGKPPRK